MSFDCDFSLGGFMTMVSLGYPGVEGYDMMQCTREPIFPGPYDCIVSTLDLYNRAITLVSSHWHLLLSFRRRR